MLLPKLPLCLPRLVLLFEGDTVSVLDPPITED